MRFMALTLGLSLCVASCGDKSCPQKRLPEQVVLSFAPVIKKIAPAVVNVYGDRQTKQATQDAQGSGLLVSKDGLVLTSAHVVRGADTITVTLADLRKFPAKVRGMDSETGLALLQIQGAQDLPYVSIPQTPPLEVGDVILAMGNPFGVGQSVTSGIVSALGHIEDGITPARTFIQTDAVVNPGNSGGPLITTDGRVVGINTAIYSKTGSFVGISFATPSHFALPLLKRGQGEGK